MRVATCISRHRAPAGPVVKPIELNKDDTNHVTSADARETQPLSKVEALRQPEHIDRWNTSTPEIAAEVADSAVLLDRMTPEPETLDEATAQEPPVTTDIAERAAEADIAAEVADTAETLDVDEASHATQLAPTDSDLSSSPKPGPKQTPSRWLPHKIPQK